MSELKILGSPSDQSSKPNVADKLQETFYDSFSIKIRDGSFNNSALKLGASDAGLNSAEYYDDMITFRRGEITAVYHGSWIFRRIIDKVAQDMWSAGITINGETSPEGIKKIQKRLSRLRPQLIWATQQARLFGGAASLIMVDDGTDDLSQPLQIKNIKRGAAIQLWSTDRWWGLEPSQEKVTNFKSKDFGYPKYYTFVLEGDGSGSESVKVHHSRVLRFVNRKSTRLINTRLDGWGISELEHIYQDLMIHENAKNSAGSLISKSLLEIIKVEGMRSAMQGLSMGSTASQSLLSGTMAAVNNFRTNNLIFMDKEDEYDQRTYTFSGLSELLDTQKDILAGAAEMPKVLLYGETKGGMTSDSPAEMEFYAGTILGKQEEQLRPVLDKLLPVIYAAEGIQVPTDLDYEFESIAGMTQDKKLSLLSGTLQAISQCVDSGLMTHETAQQELLQVQKLTGFGTNIEDRDIELAKQSDTPENAESDGEMGAGMEMGVPTGGPGNIPQPTQSMGPAPQGPAIPQQPLGDYQSVVDEICGKKTMRDKQ